jgi:hypothetical protein
VFEKFARLVLILFFATTVGARGQQAVSSITQSRLFSNPTAPGTTACDENGNPLPGNAETTSGDDSFGTQIILKNQERPKNFAVFGDASLFYTNNVDLTPDNTRSDTFAAANAGASWRPIISRGLVGEVSVGTSIFRYDKASELDFERISAGTGLTWLVPRSPGIVVFARYDFTELLDSGSTELLQDHEFTLGGQKTFAFTRSHFLTTGLAGIVGISIPRSQQRDQAAVHAAYHLQVTRDFGVDLLYRYAAQFYADDSRIDHNQTLSLGLGFNANRWLRIDGSLSAARNDSDRSAFEYEVLNLGGTVWLSARF